MIWSWFSVITWSWFNMVRRHCTKRLDCIFLIKMVVVLFPVMFCCIPYILHPFISPCLPLHDWVLSLHRCSCCVRSGLHEGVLGGVGGAGPLFVLCGDCGGCVPYGHHLQHLGVLCLLCDLQSYLHAVDHHSHVSTQTRTLSAADLCHYLIWNKTVVKILISTSPTQVSDCHQPEYEEVCAGLWCEHLHSLTAADCSHSDRGGYQRSGLGYSPTGNGACKGLFLQFYEEKDDVTTSNIHHILPCIIGSFC